MFKIYCVIYNKTTYVARVLSCCAICIPDITEFHLRSDCAQGGFKGSKCLLLSYTSRSPFKRLGFCQLGKKSWEASHAGFLSAWRFWSGSESVERSCDKCCVESLWGLLFVDCKLFIIWHKWETSFLCKGILFFSVSLKLS